MKCDGCGRSMTVTEKRLYVFPHWRSGKRRLAFCLNCGDKANNGQRLAGAEWDDALVVDGDRIDATNYEDEVTG